MQMEFLDTIWNSFIALVKNGEHIKFLMLPLYIVFIFGEAIYYQLTSLKYNITDAATSLSISALNYVFAAFIGAFIHFSIYTWLYNHFSIWHIPHIWYTWLLIFLLHDLAYYLEHRMMHRVGILWALHHVHHSSQELNFSTANRGVFLDTFFSTVFFVLPIIGVDILQFMVIVTATNIWGIFNHTKLIKSMGIFEYILCTPSNHSVHHASNTKYLDKNYGQVLIIWDQLFQSFKREDSEAPIYGLPKNITTHNPVLVEFEGIKWLKNQLKSTDNWGYKIRYLIKPPGWSHTGKHQRTEDLIKLNQNSYASQEI
jgi:sterol desaturase/sphingolipid hydroxylase (fatty acid hydroxylase superfamily)